MGHFGLADNRTPIVQPVVSLYTAFKRFTSHAQLAHVGRTLEHLHHFPTPKLGLSQLKRVNDTSDVL
jgi:hypothetical protein